MTSATKRDIPGDSVDGYAREYVCMPAHAFTKAPAGYTHVEAATLTCAANTVAASGRISARSLGERGLNIQTETAGATAASISAVSREKLMDAKKAIRDWRGSRPEQPAFRRPS